MNATALAATTETTIRSGRDGAEYRAPLGKSGRALTRSAVAVRKGHLRQEMLLCAATSNPREMTRWVIRVDSIYFTQVPLYPR